MSSYVVTAADREWFGRCPRAWDLSALGRRALEPIGGSASARLDQGLRAALAVHYFPGMWSWNRSIVDPLVVAAYEREGGPPVGRDLLARFQRWSEPVDHFTPFRVEADLDVPVPDPSRPGHDLSTPSGQRVRYRDRLPLVLVDEADERVWLGEHRVVEEFADLDELALDERLILACWAWEHVELKAPVAGVYYTEFRLDGELRRTVVAHTTTEKREAADRLGRAVLTMVATDVVVDPFPSWSHCRRCPFRAPCLAMNRGEDPEPLLTSDYRRRPVDILEEGRLGGASWGFGRGAAPPHLRGADAGGGEDP
ncbi:MAG: hypothetical protein ABWZ89_13230 [Acidimicrobiales bacterium]